MKRDRDTRPLTNDTLPHDERLEAAVLGALLVEANYVPDVRGILTADAFYNPDNAAIYEAICRLDDDVDREVDMLSAVRAVKGSNISDAYIAGLTQSIGTGVEVLNRARCLADLRTRRMLIAYAAELTAKAQAGNDATEWALSELDAITGKAVCVDAARHIGDVMQETLQDLERRQQAYQRGECVGIPTGLPFLDRITGGWRGGQLVVLAARPAMGKTAVSLHFARTAAMAGVPVCIFSLEMPNAQLTGRMLVGVSGVDANAFRRGSINATDREKIERGANDLRGSGAIEQDADMVIFIDRPAVHCPECFNAGGRYGTVDPKGVGRLTIAKNREGSTGFILFRHNESLTRIEDYERRSAGATQNDNAPY